MGDEKTRDVVFGGEVKLWQSKKGYRFGLDALLLATDLPELVCEAPEKPRVLELGAGQGAVALTIARQHQDWEILALERQPALLEHLQENILENELKNVGVISGDLREYRRLLDPQCIDLVVANPPYYALGSRRPSENKERAAARHELFGGITDFLAAAIYALKPRGLAKVILPPLRLHEALNAASTTDLRLQSLRFYHTDKEADAYLVEIIWRRGAAPDVQIKPPLYIYADASAGLYSPEVAQRLRRETR